MLRFVNSLTDALVAVFIDRDVGAILGQVVLVTKVELYSSLSANTTSL